MGANVNDGPRYATFPDYLRVVRERRTLIVLVALLFAGAAFGWSIRQPDVFQAESSVEFKDVNTESSILGTVTLDRQTPEQRAAINAQNISRREVAERARKNLRIKTPVRQLQFAVLGRPETRTNLVVVNAQWGSAEGAAAIANAFAEAAVEIETEQVRDRYREAAESQEEVLDELEDVPGVRQLRILRLDQIARLKELSKTVTAAEVLRPANVPAAPISPKPIMNTLLGLMLGLIVGLVAGFARDSLDRRFKSTREISSELTLPLVGYVREDVLGRSVVGKGRGTLEGEELEAFRILRTNVDFLDVDNPPKIVLVTSALPEEGKSTAASALACAYATAGRRTLLVECDLRRPVIAERFGLAPKPGLTDYLAGHAAPKDILQTVALTIPTGNGATPEQAPLVCIVAGSSSPQPAELLRSQRCREFLEQVSEAYDTVVIDTSPLLPVVDTLELLPRADAVVLCLRATRTTRDQARAAKGAIDHFPSRPTGVFVTGMLAHDDAYAYGYYSYATPD